MASVAGIGCCRDHTCGTGPPWVVPNSWRAAATTALSEHVSEKAEVMRIVELIRDGIAARLPRR